MTECLMLKAHFDTISCRHIYRERNTISDLISKEAMHLLRAHMEVQEQNDHAYYQYFHTPFAPAYGRGASPR